jgi:tryptophanyl-tRNA synthetase
MGTLENNFAHLMPCECAWLCKQGSKMSSSSDAGKIDLLDDPVTVSKKVRKVCAPSATFLPFTKAPKSMFALL